MQRHWRRCFFEDGILDAIRNDLNSGGSSSNKASIANTILTKYVECNLEIPNKFHEALDVKLNELVNRGTLIRSGDTFHLRPQDEWLVAHWNLGIDHGYHLGLTRVLDEVQRRVPTVQYCNIRGWREVVELVEQVVVTDSDTKPDLRAKVQQVVTALQEREEELGGGGEP